MNVVEMAGRLTREPKLKQIGKKKRAICEMRLAIDNGRYPTTFIDVSAFDAHAYVCVELLSKGSQVEVKGELRFRESRDGAGGRREHYSIVGRVEWLADPPAFESVVTAELAPTSA